MMLFEARLLASRIIHSLPCSFAWYAPGGGDNSRARRVTEVAEETSPRTLHTTLRHYNLAALIILTLVAIMQKSCSPSSIASLRAAVRPKRVSPIGARNVSDVHITRTGKPILKVQGGRLVRRKRSH